MDISGIAAAALVVVRVYSSSGVPAGDLQVAREHARVILAEAGVVVAWIDCRPGNTSGDVLPHCGRPPGRDELVVRVSTTARVSGEPSVSMGYSLVDESHSFLPRFSTVYADRVSSVARRAGTDRRQLLGRAIAHELGHLLLNSSRHADAGLMRAVWSHAELHRDVSADWRFSSVEAESLRAAVAVRAARSR